MAKTNETQRFNYNFGSSKTTDLTLGSELKKNSSAERNPQEGQSINQNVIQVKTYQLYLRKENNE